LEIRNSFSLCIKKALERSKNWRENIVIDSTILTGKPIIKGLSKDYQRIIKGKLHVV